VKRPGVPPITAATLAELFVEPLVAADDTEPTARQVHVQQHRVPGPEARRDQPIEFRIGTYRCGEPQVASAVSGNQESPAARRAGRAADAGSVLIG
jgi:hypothetical protein